MQARRPWTCVGKVRWGRPTTGMLTEQPGDDRRPGRVLCGVGSVRAKTEGDVALLATRGRSRATRQIRTWRIPGSPALNVVAFARIVDRNDR
jgi:hypothetical protein